MMEQPIDSALEIVAKELELGKDDVYIVWFAYILGGWKCLVGSNLMPDHYYELTYNKTKNETYFDSYLKVLNKVV